MDSDLDDGDQDDEEDIDDLFPFLVGEAEYLTDLASAIRKKLRVMSPSMLRKAAFFLYALERLPYRTSGLAFDLAISSRREGGMSYVSVELSSDAFRLSQGGSVYTPGVGSDSFSETAIEVEVGGFRDGSSEDFFEWLSAFKAAEGELTIEEIDLDEELDLTDGSPDDGWERLARYWDERGEGEYGY